MHGLTTNNVHLDQVLNPLSYYLDGCWWWLGGAGMSFPHIQAPKRLTPSTSDKGGSRNSPAYDPEDWNRFMRECAAAREEYSNWLVDRDGNRIGKPGFFSRYAAGLDCDWDQYYVSDAADLDDAACSLASASLQFDCRWFVWPPDGLPADVAFITRSIDGAYLDLFFRDAWAFEMVWGHLRSHGMDPKPYHPQQP